MFASGPRWHRAAQVAKGKVITEDPKLKTSTSKYELSSIPATVKELFGLPSFLTKRDEWAGSLLEAMTESGPRGDAPTHLPDAPPPSQDVPTLHGCGAPEDVTRRQKRHVDFFDNILETFSSHGDPRPALDPAAHPSPFHAAVHRVSTGIDAVFDGLKQGTFRVRQDEL